MKTSSRFDEAMQEPLGLIQFHSVPHLDPFATVAAGGSNSVLTQVANGAAAH